MLASQWKKTALLAAVLAGLGGFAYWLEYKKIPEKEKAEESSKRLLPIEKKPILKASLEAGGKRYAFECMDADKGLCKPSDQSQWKMLEPLQVKADESNVNAFLSTLSSLAIGDTIDLSGETTEKRSQLLAEYGLSSENRSKGQAKKISVERTDGEKYEAYLGDLSPIGEKVYVMVAKNGVIDENRVLLSPFYFKTYFEHDIDYWRNKRLVNVASHDIDQFDYESSSSRYSVSRKDGQWMINVSKPRADTLPGDIEAIESYLSALSFLSAKRFVNDQKTSPSGKTLLMQSKEIARITFGKNVIQVYTQKTAGKKSDSATALVTLSDQDAIAEIDAPTRDRLVRDPSALRLARLMSAPERFTIKTLTFSGGPFGPGETSIEVPSNDEAGKYLEKLATSKIMGFQDATGFKQPKDAFELRAVDDKGALKRHLLLWMKEGVAYARDKLSKRNEIYRMDTLLNAHWPKDRDFLKPTKMAPAAPEGMPSGTPST